MVIVRHVGAGGVTAFDFLPTDPRSPLTAAALLAGRGLHSFPFQLNSSASVYRMSQLNS